MKKSHCFWIATAAASFLLSAPSASASIEVGWSCTANDTEPGSTLLAAGSSGVPISPIVAQEGASVITSWKVPVGPGLGPIAQRLEVFQVANENSEYRKVAESATETLVAGMNSFPTRIPVTEGNSVGLHGPVETLLCGKEANAISVSYQGGVATGETKPFKAISTVGTPVLAVVEADKDGDGYGDETQDGCPRSTIHYTACPSVQPEVVAVAARRRAIYVKARVDSEATVKVFGSIAWGLKVLGRSQGANVSTKVTPRIAALSAGAPLTLTAGVTTAFRLPLPKVILAKLSRLQPRQALRAKITISTTDLAGRETQRRLSVRLPGRDRS